MPEPRIMPGDVLDNSPGEHSSITVTPLSAAMGAEVSGVKVASASDAQVEEIKSALWRHKMVFFRDQELSAHDQAEFSKRLGSFTADAYTEGGKDVPDVQPAIKEADEKVAYVFGQGWHTDSPFLPRPPAISMLYAVDIPPYGGDTMWANAAVAYKMLSPTMRSLLESLEVEMSLDRIGEQVRQFMLDNDSIGEREYTTKGLMGGMSVQDKFDRDLGGKFPLRTHPLVRTHPETGEKSLFIDAVYTAGIKGLTRQEADPIIQFLVDHITQPELTCRLRWQPKTLTMWDNRLCLHYATNDYDGFRREMYRTTIDGEVPA